MPGNDWWDEPWTIRAVELCIWVRENKAEQEVIGKGLRDLGFEDGKHLNNFMREYLRRQECTYVALGIGRPVRDGWQVACDRCHITVGFAAWMWGSERSRLQDILV